MAGAKPHFAPHAAYAASASAPAPTAAPASDSSSSASADAGADVIVFRLLLPRAFGDEDAFHLYAAIAPLRRNAAALQVRVDALQGYPEDSASRVAVVLGPTSPSRRVEASSSSSSGEPLQLSPVQEALVALVDVGGVLHRVVGRGPEFVTCLVLVEAARLDDQGRWTLRAITSETGAEIRFKSLAGDAKPSLHSPDEVLEITGDRTTIRKAIVALSSYVQGDLHAGTLTNSVTTASAELPRTTLEVPETNFGALHSGGSTQYAKSSIPRIDSPQGVTGDVKSKHQQQISFRLLCHVNLAGGLIGTKGLLIKSFESETGASIDVGNPYSGCTERVITISALESPGPYSTVQRAMLCIFERMEEVERNGHSTFGKPGYSTRVLVPKSQFYWLVGLGGAVIQEIVKSTGAGIEIMDEADVPACASHCERVLQITGELVDVRKALIVLSDKLRDYAFSSKSTKYDDANATSSDITESTPSRQVKIFSTSYSSTVNFPMIDHGPSLNQMNSVENSFCAFHLGSPGSSELEKSANANDVGIMKSKNAVQKSAGGSGAITITGVQKPADGSGDRINNSCIGITSPEDNKFSSHQRIKDPVVIRMTYEVAACQRVLCILYGDDGYYLAQLRQISGADITVYDPPPETSDGSIIVISGTPDQAQLALAALIDLTKKMTSSSSDPQA
ncbi:KH domain-containing protein HEN4 [Lolium perenne]|uniref:KH domain-containing protein HEN4 n=1 Tax=Lolium perenne TaxID=4522 RepID=UPI0021F62A99|nr:KH domain-containing protein HEN4-like isoform X1 [Lolium perenne]